LVLLAGFAGMAIIRLQGLATLRRVRSELDRGAMPGAALFDGACLVFAGLLLIIPGFLTDIVALLLLMPPLRAALRTWLGRRVRVKAARGTAGRTAGEAVIIEGDFTEVKRDEPATDSGKPSPWLRDTRGNA
jgi:UPF0716 protein FxsA